MLCLLLALASLASAKPDELEPDQIRFCEEAEKKGLPDWKQPELSELPPPSTDPALTHELPLAVTVVNHDGGFFTFRADEDEIAYHLERAREAYRGCGVEVVLESLRYVRAPDFLDSLGRGVDYGSRLSPTERCLLEATHKEGVVNVYFVEEVDSDKGESRSHAISRRALTGGEYSLEGSTRFAGAVFVTDGSRAHHRPGSREAVYREVVFAHEIGHVVLESQDLDRRDPNLMSKSSLALKLDDAQCASLKSLPWVRARRP